MNSNTLAAMTHLLNESGWNYSVFLQTYPVSRIGGESSEQLIHAALSNSAVIENIQEVTTQEVIYEVNASLSYAGSSCDGPDQSVIESEQFKGLLATLLIDVEAESSVSVMVEKFCLKEGHPAYPVFWDFAFLFTGAKKASVFIGSSSD